MNMLKNFQALLAHERNQQGAMQRAAQAQAQGLDPAAFATPFPGAHITNTTTTNTGGGILKGALIAALMAVGGGAATWGLLSGGPAVKAPVEHEAKLKPFVPQPPTKTTPSPSPSSPSLYDAVYEEQQPDGTWKEIKRERLKP